MTALIIFAVVIAIGLLLYFKTPKGTKSGKVTNPSPSPKRDNDNKTKKDIEV